jgi:similar to stage IV sporulation protein
MLEKILLKKRLLLILKIIRWLFGYIIFKTDAKNSRLFLNLVSKSKTKIWDINKINKILYAKVNSSEYNHLFFLTRQNNIKLQIIQRIGLAFFYSRNKNRKGIIFGIILFFLIIKIFSLFIWKINIIGVKNLNKNQIFEVSKLNGVFTGQFKKNIDAQIAGQNIMNKIPGIAWISVNLEGCVANISIKEQINKPEFENNSEPQNIIASCDAQIFRMETFKGTPIMKAGDTVLKNQILVSKFIEDKDGNMNETCAKANVWAKVQDEISFSEKFEKIINLRTGISKKIFKFNFLNRNFNINFWQKPDNNWEKETKENNINFFGIKIPTGITTEEFFETKKIKIIKTKQELIEETKTKAYDILKEKNLDITKCTEQISETKNGINFKLKFEYLKNIAVPEGK